VLEDTELPLAELAKILSLLLDGHRRQLAAGDLEQHLQAELKALGRSIKGDPGPVLSAFLERQPRLQALGSCPGCDKMGFCAVGLAMGVPSRARLSLLTGPRPFLAPAPWPPPQPS